MKKKVVSVLVAVSMCLSTGVSAGAAAMDDTDFVTETTVEQVAPAETAEDVAEEYVPEDTVVYGEEPASETEAQPSEESVPEESAETVPTEDVMQEEEFFEDGFVSVDNFEADQEVNFTDENLGGFDANMSGAKETGNVPEQSTPNSWIWDKETGAFHYYGADGKLSDALPAADGYYEINGDYYSLNAMGVPQTGDITLTRGGVTATYYFDPATAADGIYGKMFRNGWRCIQNNGTEQWMFYNTGESAPEQMGQLYEHGIITTTLDGLKGEGTYLLDANGFIMKKAVVKAENGKWYASNKLGQLYTSRFVTYKGYKYYFGSKGSKVEWTNSWHRCDGAGNRMYYFGKTPGRMVKKTGWQRVYKTNKKFYGWFYFNKNGNHYQNRWKSGYFFKEDGRLASGLTVIDGKTYFFAVSTSGVRNGKLVKNQIFTYKKQKYMTDANGAVQTSGWRKFDDNWYYLKDMQVVKDAFAKKGSTYGYLDSQGRFMTGWVVVSNSKNQVKYLDPAKVGFVKNTRRLINGKWYYFDEDGYRINDLTSKFTGPYTLEVDRVNGVMTVYADSARTIPVKSIRVSVGLPGTPTPTGPYRLSRAGRWQSLMGPSYGQYASHVDGAGQGGIFVHSIACEQPNSYNLFVPGYNSLGNPASHGCIRTCVADALWVYNNCNGSAIYIFDGTFNSEEVFKGPLGRRALVQLRGAANFDPTDPAVA